MSRGTNQKFKFTYLMKIMLAKTDDEHALTMSQIKDELEKYDVTAERKSIYADFPGGSGPINHFLEITFQMLQTFHVSKFKSVMVIDGKEEEPEGCYSQRFQQDPFSCVHSRGRSVRCHKNENKHGMYR